MRHRRAVFRPFHLHVTGRYASRFMTSTALGLPTALSKRAATRFKCDHSRPTTSDRHAANTLACICRVQVPASFWMCPVVESFRALVALVVMGSLGYSPGARRNADKVGGSDVDSSRHGSWCDRSHWERSVYVASAPTGAGCCETHQRSFRRSSPGRSPGRSPGPDEGTARHRASGIRSRHLPVSLVY